MAAIAGALLKIDEANSGIDWTQVIIAGFLFAGVIVTSVFGFLGVRFAKGAKAEAKVLKSAASVNGNLLVRKPYFPTSSPSSISP